MNMLHHSTLAISIALVVLASCQPDHSALPSGSSEAVSAYVVDRVGLTSSGGQAFCAYEPLADMRNSGAEAEVYLWVLCEEFYLEGETLHAGTATSLPLVLTLRRDDGSYRVVADSIHGEVAPSEEQVRALFPPPAWASILPQTDQDAANFNDLVDRLEREVREQAVGAMDTQNH